MHSYWLDLFTGKTWREFLAAGGEVSGFRLSRWKTVQRIQRGDYLLCYLTGVSRWIGVLEVTSEPFKDSTPIWEEDDFPCRLRVKPLVTLTPETAVPIHELRHLLTIFRGKGKNTWTGSLRGSPRLWKPEDGEAVLDAVMGAKNRPVVRSFDPSKLERRPRLLRSKVGPVMVPEPEALKEETSHTEIQWLLLKLGNDMGLNVWVARNDKSRGYRGRRFSDLENLRSELPRQFDEATNRTIEHIDVLWLDDNEFTAAFEIESTTSVYSGLLRLADLVAMQPNLKIPLYIVAPDERREKVIAEVNRPTFSRLRPPLKRICRFIPFSALRRQLSQAAGFVRHLRPEFLEDVSESCEVPIS